MTGIKRPLRVFLYHAPVDRIAARDLYLRLINDGVDAWLVKEKILPGQDWKEEIQNAVREADVVLVCISGQFDQLDSRQKEVWAAFVSVIEGLDGEDLVIPVCLDACDLPENLKNWQRVDLFEEGGYEMLLQALQAEASELGVDIQARDGSLPQITTLSVNHEQPIEKPAKVTQGRLEVIEGAGILIEDPAVKEHKPGRAILLALFGFAAIMMMALFGPSWIEQSHQLTLTAEPELTQTSAPGKQVSPVATPTLKLIPTLTGKGKVSHIVFLIDTSGSMQGQMIRMIRSAALKLVSRLGGEYLVSVIEFDTNVELRMAATRDHAAVGAVIESITVDVSHNGSCIWDAMYAGFQQASFLPVANDTESIIVLLTDVAIGEYVNWDCSIRSDEDFSNLAGNLSVPIFSIYVGDDLAENSFVVRTAGEGAILQAKSEKTIESTLLSISQATGLELNAEAGIPAQTTDSRDVSMVFVPAGEFIMGSNTVHLDSFWIDKTEVTNAMYGRCVRVGACSPPRSIHSHTHASYFGNPAFDDFPVIYVSWVNAQNYCNWAGGRLPTEAEWEKAARGTDGRTFPWGDQDPSAVTGLLNFYGQDTTEVGIFPNGASPYGALDMAGNVSEWVADWLSQDHYNNPPPSNPLGPDSGEYRVWRGGSWATMYTDLVRTYSRTGNFPTDSSGGIGFRCARDASL